MLKVSLVLLEPAGDPRHHGPPQPHQTLSRVQGVFIFWGADHENGGGGNDDDAGHHGYYQPIRTLFAFRWCIEFLERNFASTNINYIRSINVVATQK